MIISPASGQIKGENSLGEIAGVKTPPLNTVRLLNSGQVQAGGTKVDHAYETVGHGRPLDQVRIMNHPGCLDPTVILLASYYPIMLGPR